MVIHTENSEYYFTSIQAFIQDILPGLGLKLVDVFAVCSYVPDENARNLVMDTFPNCHVYYPGAISFTNHNDALFQGAVETEGNLPMKKALDAQIRDAEGKACSQKAEQNISIGINAEKSECCR